MPEAPQPFSLGYATPPTRAAPEILCVVAWRCGFVPPVFWTSCVVGYWITGWKGFSALGMATLAAGAPAVIVGIVLAITYLALAAVRQTGARQRRRGTFALILLGADIGLGAVCFYWWVSKM